MSSMFGSSSSSSAQLSHDHSTQFTFVWQSLLLWSEAMRSMYRYVVLLTTGSAVVIDGRAVCCFCLSHTNNP